MLEENARVALMIGESLRDQTIQMGLYEMENLLNKCVFKRAFFIANVTHCTFLQYHFHIFTSRFREALVDFGKEHRKEPSNNKSKFYLHYLLASISNCIILK